jgi:hypothetical protein
VKELCSVLEFLQSVFYCLAGCVYLHRFLFDFDIGPGSLNLGYLFMDFVRLQERRNLKAFYARKSFYVSIQLYPAALAASFATKVGQDL